ncbi:hypothetical protein CEXT_176041 [Caerostris extrusa]|uniref:Reverse transcriptase domain-containing protein n=1 Tax=Caerostris extrusa TaxID=172846 RepID=A0AAV4P8I2_CAEEX|nr:hypothetical protein CEXT_176041 [Caerostris extrusa]
MSCETALFQLRSLVEEKARSRWCVCIISLDVAGAFDNVWWPSVLYLLTKAKCPKNIYDVVLPQNCKLQAYADDLVLVVWAKDKPSLEQQGSHVLEQLESVGSPPQTEDDRPATDCYGKYHRQSGGRDEVSGSNVGPPCPSTDI